MLKKQRLSDLHKKYSMKACSIAHDTANSNKVQQGTALQSRCNERKGKQANA